jgi:hypothetical protein
MLLMLLQLHSQPLLLQNQSHAGLQGMEVSRDRLQALLLLPARQQSQ